MVGTKGHSGKYTRTEEHKQHISNALKGRCSPMTGKHHSEETKKKMSNSHMEKVFSEEHRKNISKSHKGYKQSEEQKRITSEAMKGHIVTEETRRKISKGNKGKPKTEEHRRKISKSHQGIVATEETRKKMSESQKGKKYLNEIYPNHGMRNKNHSEETKRKIGERNRGHIHTINTINKIKEVRAKQKIPTKDTSIEVKIQNFLKQLGIEFFTHQYMKIEHGYLCDILIPSMNMVIECDGDYWHKYPIGKEVDHIRTKELIKKGFKVLRLWEFEINQMSVKDFKERLK